MTNARSVRQEERIPQLLMWRRLLPTLPLKNPAKLSFFGEQNLLRNERKQVFLWTGKKGAKLYPSKKIAQRRLVPSKSFSRVPPFFFRARLLRVTRQKSPKYDCF